MNPKEILDTLDYLNINEIEMANVELGEMGKERIRKKIKNTIKNSRNKKIKKTAIAVTLAFGILTIGVISKPVIAANIPIIGDIYKELGFFKGFEEYTNYIGETKEVDGYKFTIDNIVGTPTDLLIGVKVESPVPLKEKVKEDNFRIDVDMSNFGINSWSSMTDINYLDEYTAVLTAEISTTENKFKELGEINLSATKVLDDETYISCNFDVKVDFNSSFRNIEKLNVNEIINEKIKIKFIEGNIMESKIWFNDLGAFEENAVFYLMVDGKAYMWWDGNGVEDTSFIIPRMVSVLNFPNVKYEDIKNAKDIKIIYGEIGDGYRENLDIKLTEREGIKYPGEINYEEDLKGGFYDVKRENGMIKFYFKSNYNPLTLFRDIKLREVKGEEKYGQSILGGFYENPEKEGEYVLEFEDIDTNNSLELVYSHRTNNLSELKDYKVIDVK
ncbi:DUF4179 domain-containing protein [Clostridium perfringens]|uniref:DUF4179 domain-containing protein n=1 Tax=Clostridium perfringens TaxID=1502 RepID=UPI00112B2DE2|nr:DUF4179 domain-containing protein [Clostridium perfringens]MBO3328331.1 DUF4179 domain-containing protein [Clostridium perfringens]MBX9098705.1 DUF4179 domain-containing protein [Clostridium perfringens]MDB2039718.1 DUF4179 domain-containing protein [Clostridium perfringens]MDB2048649.1 DUF4179 domain-containing protein [Clostridium perfringens]MDK0638474.1 DUF4179 domain-containing protein [Clostridium perfringens]